MTSLNFVLVTEAQSLTFSVIFFRLQF